MPPGSLDGFPRLEAYKNAFFELPQIKDYLDKNQLTPVNNKVAFLK